MASSRQEYFLLRNDVPVAKTNNFLKALLSTHNADCVEKGELLVKESQPYIVNHAMYSLALDKSKKVSCSIYDVVPLDEDDYEWLVAIPKPTDRYQVYTQRDKFKAVKKLQVGDRVWVTLPLSDGAPFQSSGCTCCKATVQYIGPLQGMPGRYAGVELEVRHKMFLAISVARSIPSFLHVGIHLVAYYQQFISQCWCNHVPTCTFVLGFVSI